MRRRQNRLIRIAILHYLSDPLLYGISTRVLVSKVYNELKPVFPALSTYHVWGNISFLLKYGYGIKFCVRSPGYSLIA